MAKVKIELICDEDIADELASYSNDRVGIIGRLKVYRVLSRDCRSKDDRSHEFIGIHDNHRHLIVLYIRQKTCLAYDRAISDEILKTKILRTGTSTYELQED